MAKQTTKRLSFFLTRDRADYRNPEIILWDSGVEPTMSDNGLWDYDSPSNKKVVRTSHLEDLAKLIPFGAKIELRGRVIEKHRKRVR